MSESSMCIVVSISHKLLGMMVLIICYYFQIIDRDSQISSSTSPGIASSVIIQAIEDTIQG
jgi:hypothetical protein